MLLQNAEWLGIVRLFFSQKPTLISILYTFSSCFCVPISMNSVLLSLILRLCVNIQDLTSVIHIFMLLIAACSSSGLGLKAADYHQHNLQPLADVHVLHHTTSLSIPEMPLVRHSFLVGLQLLPCMHFQQCQTEN